MVRSRLAGCLAALVWAGACTSPSHDVPPLPDSDTPTRTTAVEQRDERDAVIDAYEAFWPRLTDASAQPEEKWQPLLAEVATDPQLSRSVGGIRQLHAQSSKIYGSVSARVTTVEVSGDRATLKDCQDASHSGQADANTGDPKTVGVERNPVSATLVRGRDEVWRVSEIVYPGGTC